MSPFSLDVRCESPGLHTRDWDLFFLHTRDWWDIPGVTPGTRKLCSCLLAYSNGNGLEQRFVASDHGYWTFLWDWGTAWTALKALNRRESIDIIEQ